MAGGLAVSGMALAGAPWPATLLAIVIAAVCGVVAAFAPQESQDRLAALRAILAHRRWRVQRRPVREPGRRSLPRGEPPDGR